MKVQLSLGTLQNFANIAPELSWNCIKFAACYEFFPTLTKKWFSMILLDLWDTRYLWIQAWHFIDSELKSKLYRKSSGFESDGPLWNWDNVGRPDNLTKWWAIIFMLVGIPCVQSTRKRIKKQHITRTASGIACNKLPPTEDFRQYKERSLTHFCRF